MIREAPGMARGPAPSSLSPVPPSPGGAASGARTIWVSEEVPAPRHSGSHAPDGCLKCRRDALGGGGEEGRGGKGGEEGELSWGKGRRKRVLEGVDITFHLNISHS